MYVCVCKGITDKDIRRAAETGVEGFEELQALLDVSSQCGSCENMARDILDEHVREIAARTPFYAAA